MRFMSGAWSNAEGVASWQASAAQRERTMAETTELLLSAAKVGPGSRVLEIGAGTGDVALLVARRVGAAGSVLATDASAAMLEVAARGAKEAGVANLSTLPVRAEELQLPPSSFDAVVSRNAVMFVSDLPRAFRAALSALRPGGRFAASMWSPEERNPYHGIPIAAVRRRGAIPDPVPEMVRAFTLSDGKTVADALREVGFTGTKVQRASATRSFPSLEEALRSARELPTFGALLALLSEKEREEVWQETARAWSRFATAGRADLPGEQIIVSAEKPG